MAKRIKKNRFVAIITRDAGGITVRADYIVECDDCGEAKQKSLERTPPPAKAQEYDAELELIRQYVAQQEGAELEG